MITLKTAKPGQYVQINDELTVTGDPELAEVVRHLIEQIDPANQYTDTMPYLFYALQAQGWDVTADPETLKQDPFKPDVVY